MATKNNMAEIINLIKSFAGQANILTIPRAFVDLTGDLKAALFLSQCVYWSSRSSTQGLFYKTYQEWQNEIAMSRYEIDQCRKRSLRWVTTRLKQAKGAPVLHYSVHMEMIAADLIDLYSTEESSGSQMDLRETDKSICKKPANPFVSDSQMDLSESDISSMRALNVLTETTSELTAEITAEINSTPPTKIDSTQNNDSNHAAVLPQKILDALQSFQWRGPITDVERAWSEDAERVRQWLWYARCNNWSGALLRTVIRSSGEYPPELDPSSDLSRRRYTSGKYSDFISH